MALRGWEHVDSGPWSDSPDHEGYARYEVGRTAARDVWALRVAEEQSIAAVIRNAQGLAEHDIVATLLSAAEASGNWPCLEEYQREGRFFLSRTPLNPPGPEDA